MRGLRGGTRVIVEMHRMKVRVRNIRNVPFGYRNYYGKKYV